MSRDKDFERLCQLEKGKNSGSLTTIHKRHLASTKLSPTLVQKTSDHEWKIKSGEAKWEYTVTMECEQCQELCQLILFVRIVRCAFICILVPVWIS